MFLITITDSVPFFILKCRGFIRSSKFENRIHVFFHRLPANRKQRPANIVLKIGTDFSTRGNRVRGALFQNVQARGGWGGPRVSVCLSPRFPIHRVNFPKSAHPPSPIKGSVFLLTEL